jgi:glycosyltransferase involved in cell wall biosynthesis
MIVPEPFMQPRGTPFSVYHRARALGKLGHQIDLVTYPVGEDVALEGVSIRRTWPIPFLTNVKIGPSLAKVLLDCLLFLHSGALLVRGRYDCIHTHQEAGTFGVILGKVFHTPHLYDMHSDLSEDLSNFKKTSNQTLIKLMRRAVRSMLRSAAVVIVICDELGDTARLLAPGIPVVVIPNTAVAAEETERAQSGLGATEAVERLRSELGLPEDRQVLLYTGTFEVYQGLELLVDSMPRVLSDCPQATYLIVGGRPDQIASLRKRAEQLLVGHALVMPGQRPAEDMPALMRLADVLVSPRAWGTNTPLKVYSYMHAGKAVLATDIRSHTQCLAPDVAVLTKPDPEGLALGAIALLRDPDLRLRLGRSVRALARERYGYESFLTQTVEAYRYIARGVVRPDLTSTASHATDEAVR